MESDLKNLITELLHHVESTDSSFALNRKVGVLTHPIPFFGDLPNAVVATVGLNPSATEFREGRWPDKVDAATLTDKLIHYFDRQPHPWFDKWEKSLAVIGASYQTNAAHIDISPRATINAGGVDDQASFESMLGIDLPWMIRFLGMAPRLQLVLMAGTATSALYLNEFINKKLPHTSGRLEGSLTRPRGRAKVKHHALIFENRRIPVYFCSSSPSDRRNPGLLQTRIQEDAELLRGYLSS